MKKLIIFLTFFIALCGNVNAIEKKFVGAENSTPDHLPAEKGQRWLFYI